MGKILSKAKTVGKNYYFYCVLYSLGIIGIIIITIARHNIIDNALGSDWPFWLEIIYLLGTLFSLPILSLLFLQRITRGIAIFVAGIISLIIMIVYWISTTGAETFITTLRDVLAPFLAIFFIYSVATSLYTIWPKIKSK